MVKSKHSRHFLLIPLFLTSLSIAAISLQFRPAYADSFSMIGEWAGSSDCPITFYKDDGGSVEGNCDNGSYNHIFSGNYSNPSQISLTLTRIDPNHCVTSVPGYIQVINNNHVKYWQGGWDGCGVRTQPVTQDWYRLPRTPDAPLQEIPPPATPPVTPPTTPPTTPPATPPTTTNQQPCLLKFGEFCIFPPPQ
jgi:hypothetical protein